MKLAGLCTGSTALAGTDPNKTEKPHRNITSQVECATILSTSGQGACSSPGILREHPQQYR